MWDDPTLSGFLRRAEPVVIKGGCPFSRKLVGKWTFAHLAELYQDELMLHFAPRHITRFNRFYGRGLGTGGVRKGPFPQFMQLSAANEACADPAYRFYVQAPVLWARGADGNAPEGGGSVRVAA